jgi:hypothetical protein
MDISGQDEKIMGQAIEQVITSLLTDTEFRVALKKVHQQVDDSI